MRADPMTAPQAGAIAVRAPATGELLGEAPDTSAAEVRAAVARARVAQAEWGARPVRERVRRIDPFRAAVARRAGEIADALVRECGKPRAEAIFEPAIVADFASYFGKRAEEILAPRPIPLHLMLHRKSYVHYAPRGVIGIISPWNFPFFIPMADAVMAWLAGNAVVLKPSEVTPLCALLGKRVFDEAGLPPDLFQVVTGRGAAGAALIDAGIDMCVFTGSVATGREVAAACGERLVHCVLELGGKAPAIVCADADLERTARALVWGGFANSGQICASVERVYAVAPVYERLCERVAELTRELRQGDPARGVVDVGSMTWARQIEIVEDRVREAIEAGARALAGGKRRAGLDAGLFWEPTVLADCTQDMDVMRKETFGPVLPLMRVADEEEALRLANDSHLGLIAYVFSRDRHKALRIAERVEAGTVMVNDVVMAAGAPELPWGGVKQSGIGRVHSEEGLRDLCHARHVNVDRIRPFARDPWWYPYSETVSRRILGAARWLFR